MKKKTKKTANKVAKKTSYYANIYDMGGQIVVQGNTFKSKSEAAANKAPVDWTYLKSVLVYKR